MRPGTSTISSTSRSIETVNPGGVDRDVFADLVGKSAGIGGLEARFRRSGARLPLCDRLSRPVDQIRGQLLLQ
ncbi:MAG: hypothetical protein L0220_30835, partial [Acidobacteria bacterium]|nr:hypothetical protein [Acidobacteriota bacterium]